MLVSLVALAAALAAALAGTSSAGEAVAPVCRPDTDCKLVTIASREFFFDVKGVLLNIIFIEENHLKVWCDTSVFTDTPPAADAAELPALSAAAAVDHVVFSGCRLPASYAGALAALNVTAAQSLEIVINENDALLQRHHFADLNVPSIIIRAVDSPTEDDFLSDVTGLRKLQLHNLRLSEKARRNLPVTLTKLLLHNALVTPVRSLRWLERLRSLSILNIFQEGEDAPLTPPLMGPFRNLTDVELQVPLEIPPLWLNGSALRSLSLRACGLRGLRADTFTGVNLTALSITKDDLRSAPAGLISKLRWLRVLDVSQSGLDGAALRRLAGPLDRLQELRANHNALGSLCPYTGFFKDPIKAYYTSTVNREHPPTTILPTIPCSSQNRKILYLDKEGFLGRAPSGQQLLRMPRREAKHVSRYNIFRFCELHGIVGRIVVGGCSLLTVLV